ncbi:hypothetical protein ACFYNY_20075 [Streptomyces sp. NPDC006530]|uniref:hypothetical protein n=1 Tax=Streptomyces sp. NPDC006530 TaxID=3364750 RepID=UPI0036BF393D
MRTSRIRRGVVGLLATAGLIGGLAAAGPAQAAPAQARAKVYLTTSVTQWTHYQPNLHSHAGTLYAGRNYFYCWTAGDWYQNNGHVSGAWLRTDDDTGHRNVYVNMVNLSDADFWRAQNMLPQC